MLGFNRVQQYLKWILVGFIASLLVLYMATSSARSPIKDWYRAADGVLGWQQQREGGSPRENHVQEAYARGSMYKIAAEDRLETYKNYPQYDLWREDMPQILEGWRKHYRPSDVYDVLKHVPKPTYLEGYKNPCYEDGDGEVRCLPHFMVIGIQKCGTTDLYDKIGTHPAVAKAGTKEPFWWNRQRMIGKDWEEYLHVFAGATQKIQSNTEMQNGQDLHPVVTGEGSAGTIWDSHNWMSVPENAGYSEPVNLTGNVIQKYLPNAKFILIVREPTQRLYSDYHFFAGRHYRTSPEDFHQRVRYGITWLEECFQTLSIRHCLFDPPGRNLTEINPQYYVGFYFNPVARLRLGLYSEYLATWNSIFPAKQTLVMRLKDYSADRLAGINRIYKHIGLEPLDESYRDKLEDMKVKMASHKTKLPMLDSTKLLLDNFYAYFKQRLAQMMKDDIFLWED